MTHAEPCNKFGEECLSCAMVRVRDTILSTGARKIILLGVEYFNCLIQGAKTGTKMYRKLMDQLFASHCIPACLLCCGRAIKDADVRYNAFLALADLSATAENSTAIATCDGICFLLEVLAESSAAAAVPAGQDYRPSILAILSNIARNDASQCHLLVRQGCLAVIGQLAADSPAEVLREAAGLLSIMAGHISSSAVKWAEVSTCVDFAISAIRADGTLSSTTTDLLYFLAHLVDANDLLAEKLTMASRWPAIVQALGSVEFSVSYRAVDLIGTIAQGSAVVVERMLRPEDAVLHRLHAFTTHKEANMRNKALFAVSNMLGDATTSQIDAVEEIGFLAVFVHGIINSGNDGDSDGDKRHQRRSVRCLANFVSAGSDEHISALCGYSSTLLPGLCSILKTATAAAAQSGSSSDDETDEIMLSDVLEILERILKYLGTDAGSKQRVGTTVQGVKSRLRKLAHLQTDLGDQARWLKKTYFPRKPRC